MVTKIHHFPKEMYQPLNLQTFVLGALHHRLTARAWRETPATVLEIGRECIDWWAEEIKINTSLIGHIQWFMILFMIPYVLAKLCLCHDDTIIINQPSLISMLSPYLDGFKSIPPGEKVNDIVSPAEIAILTPTQTSFRFATSGHSNSSQWTDPTWNDLQWLIQDGTPSNSVQLRFKWLNSMVDMVHITN